MNKYQIAYKRLSSKKYQYVTTDGVYKDIKTLGELVDKETPKKPDYEGDSYDFNGEIIYDTWICPNCDKRYEVDYDDYDYCPNCGQKIDWEE